ncbi:universal stress protein [Leptolyngbya sp. AN03gr2]|uniref:universal stress protein n=1 Tax=unclassified Leptolyngbya TaxID=2650499 RepID=UPI003D30F691
MFDKILVAIDESKQSDLVIEKAISLAEALKAQLRFFHVLSSAEEDFPSYPFALTNVGFVVDEAVYQELIQGYAQERQEFEQRHLDRLRAMVHQAHQSNIAADYCLTYGSPGKEICQMAKDWEADAILIGRRGRSGLQEVMLGSVSNYVVHHAICSVLVIQKPADLKAEQDAENEFAYA